LIDGSSVDFPERVLTLDQLDNLDGLLVLVHLHRDACRGEIGLK
jgi:hypothetical protein